MIKSTPILYKWRNKIMIGKIKQNYNCVKHKSACNIKDKSKIGSSYFFADDFDNDDDDGMMIS